MPAASGARLERRAVDEVAEVGVAETGCARRGFGREPLRVVRGGQVAHVRSEEVERVGGQPFLVRQQAGHRDAMRIRRRGQAQRWPYVRQRRVQRQYAAAV